MVSTTRPQKQAPSGDRHHRVAELHAALGHALDRRQIYRASALARDIHRLGYRLEPIGPIGTRLIDLRDGGAA